MAFENLVEPDDEEMPEPEPEEGGNNSFMIIAGVLGGIAVLALLFIVVYVLFLRPGQQRSQQAQLATVEAQRTQISMALTATSDMLAQAAPTLTHTPSPLPPTETATPVVAQPTATNTVAPTADSRTATVAALLTQAALTPTAGSTTPTQTGEIPDAGFADDVGLPALLGMGALFLVCLLYTSDAADE